MPQEDAVSKALAGAKTTLANATKFTQSVEGNPTSSFAPKEPEKPKIPQVHSSASRASYSLAHNPPREEKAIPGGNPNISEEINARQRMGAGVE